MNAKVKKLGLPPREKVRNLQDRVTRNVFAGAFGVARPRDLPVARFDLETGVNCEVTGGFVTCSCPTQDAYPTV